MALDKVWVGATGPTEARIAFVGEAPGKEEAREGEPFIGPSGQILWPWLTRLIGLRRSQVYVTNWHKTMLTDERKAELEKKPELVDEHSSALLEELQQLPQLRLVVALGAYALRALVSDRRVNLYWANGLAIESEPWDVMPIVHPAAGMHAPKMLERTWQGLLGLKRFLADGHRWPGFSDLGKDWLVKTRQKKFPWGEVPVPHEDAWFGSVAIDTEGQPDDPFCLSYSTDPENSYVIYADDRGPLEKFNRWLQETRPTIYMHNALYDVDVLLAMGIDVRNGDIRDTMIMANLLQDVPRDLKNLTMRELAVPMTPYLSVVRPWQKVAVDKWRREVYTAGLDLLSLEQQYTPKGKARTGQGQFKLVGPPHAIKIKRNFERGFKFQLNEQKWGEAQAGPMPGPELRLVPPDVHVPYAGKDARVTLGLARILEDRVQAQGLGDVSNLDHAVMPTIHSMQQTGMFLSMERYHEVMAEISVERERLLEDLREQVGDEGFNPGSPDQVELALREREYELTKLTKSRKRYSTNENVLKILRERYSDTKFLDSLLAYREHDKYINAYLLPLGQKIQKTADGHRLFHRFGAPTVSGRLTGQVLTWPSRTKLGKKLRSIFRAPPGKILVAWDLSQIELRLAAAFSEDPIMTRAFTDGRDLHANLAADLFGKPYEECTKEPGKTDFRYPAKTIHYLLLYGGQGGRLYEELRGAGVTGYSEAQCQRLLDDTWEVYAEAGRYLRGKAREAKQNGFVTDWLGRRRFLPGTTIQDAGFGWVLRGLRLEAERQAGNYDIQGGAAEIIKRAMLVAQEEILPKTGLKLWLQVHDELMGELPEDEWENVDGLMVDAMTRDSALTDPIMIETEGARGETWDQLK